jgi:hypothetical protein
VGCINNRNEIASKNQFKSHLSHSGDRVAPEKPDILAGLPRHPLPGPFQEWPMTITENDFNEFVKKADKIMGRYASCLENRSAFARLQDDPDFKAENHEMYTASSSFLIPAPEVADSLTSEALNAFLIALERFVEKWKTRPISSWLFSDSVEGLKEGAELFFSDLGIFETIKVYPWSTKEDVNADFDKIRKSQPYIPLRPEHYPTNFKIKAFRDAKWKWAEIQSFLSRENGADADKQVESAIEKRSAELKKAGKSEKEIDEILDREFPPYQAENELNYDALRKRKSAADKLCAEYLDLFKIGK